MRRITFIPQTNVGRWSAAATALFIFLTATSQFLARAQQTANGIAVITPSSSPELAIFGITTFIFGVLAFILGVISLFKKDTSIFVLFSIALGLFPIFFMLGEFILPH